MDGKFNTSNLESKGFTNLKEIIVEEESLDTIINWSYILDQATNINKFMYRVCDVTELAKFSVNKGIAACLDYQTNKFKVYSFDVFEFILGDSDENSNYDDPNIKAIEENTIVISNI